MIERTLVTEAPAKIEQSKFGEKTILDSQAVMERLWSDGMTSYKCAWEGCSYESTNQRSVAHHYGAKHKRATYARRTKKQIAADKRKASLAARVDKQAPPPPSDIASALRTLLGLPDDHDATDETAAYDERIEALEDGLRVATDSLRAVIGLLDSLSENDA